MSVQYGPNRFSEFDITEHEDEEGVQFKPSFSAEVDELTKLIYKMDCIRVSSEVTSKMIAENRKRRNPLSIETIASNFVCEQMERDFELDYDLGDDDSYAGLTPSMYEM